jgi:hypothetical protein
MGLFSIFSKAGKNTVDAAVSFADGTTPAPTLENPAKAYISVVVLGVLLLGGSGWIFWENMHSYFRPKKVAVQNVVADTEVVKKLKTQDTDGDGLSDYSELYAYHSSPYLFSTAGDGISDGVKINSNQNPSCPQGQSCSLINVALPSDTNTALNANYLRQALVAAGVSQETVANTNDSDLMKMYQNIVNAANNANIANPTVGDLTNLSGASVRTLLTNIGVDPTVLSKVDDTTLEAIFSQVIAQDSNSNSSNTN